MCLKKLEVDIKATKLRRNGYRVKHQGDLIQIDGVVISIYGRRYYIANAIDYKTDIAVSKILNNGNSLSTASFLEELPSILGFPIKAIQTDNGSEFMAYFHDKTKEMSITHFYNYVRKPKYNGKIERFNRTLQEELLNDTDMRELIALNTAKAQKIIDDWLVWYNNERPNQALNYKTPCR